jgi:N-acetylglucosamine-6-phosphate deacetylase
MHDVVILVLLCNDVFNNINFFAGCTKVEALEAATLHPAELLNITHSKGTLNYDTDADFVFLDDKLNVLKTYIAGELVWSKT